jgi:peptidoglycan/LPS O-acetylase OafA/YrhL
MFKKFNLSRKTNSTNFIPEIDGLRFFAIATVVIFHLNTAFSGEVGQTVQGSIELLGGKNTFSIGGVLVRLDLGVKVFFAISGFILALPFLKAMNENKRINILFYFKRRLTRLEPPFIISLLLFSIVHIIVFHERIANVLLHFFVGLFYSHGFVFGEPNFINPVTWSLETEAQFYILVPLLFFFFKMLKKDAFKIALFLAIFIGSMIFKNSTSENGYLNSSIFAYFLNFAVGIFFAAIYIRSKAFFEGKKNLIYDLLGIASILGMFIFYKPQADIMNMAFFNSSIFLFFLSAFMGRIFNYFFTRKWVYTIGGMCYSIYLLHYAFFHLFVKFSKSLAFSQDYGVNLGIQIVTALPVVLFVSAVFFVLVERPCMNPEWPKFLRIRLNQLLKK